MKWTIVLLLCLIAIGGCRRRRRRRHCHEDSLEMRGKLASVILTGTVEKVYRRRRSLVYQGTVKVRRVVKGRESLNNNSVVINGFGNPLICRSDIRPRDTRLFLLTKSDGGGLWLNSSLARVSLKNLEKAGIFSWEGKSPGKSTHYRYSSFGSVSSSKSVASGRPDAPVKKRPVVEEATCEKICFYGAVCVIDEVTKKAFCRCPENCHNKFTPVCGSDGVTYSNECNLIWEACKQQNLISVKSHGDCDAVDPCAGKKCHFHGTCKVMLDRIHSECICPEKCARYGNNRGSRSVCGSDGVDYPSVCELRRSSCLQKKKIQIKYSGQCDPCDGVLCPANQVCQLDDNRNHICRCNGDCPKDHNPVCGSDGKTYTNECLMKVEACKARKDLRTIHKGECDDKTNPCGRNSNVQCHYGEECHISTHGIASCHCPEYCEAVMKPVCGSDEVTYNNECELKRRACYRRLPITVKYRGICGDNGPCSDYKCSYGSMCIVERDKPKCECPTCSAEFKPVCGDNGITYNNECKLKQEGCELKTEIKVAYAGFCNGCEKKKCDFYAVCGTDTNGHAVCICPAQCVRYNATVCGSDGISYPNECELKSTACKKKQNIKVVSLGACDLCKDVHCKFGAKCENGNCVCPTDCPDTYEPLCGSNGVTYSNECQLKRTECQIGKEVIVASYGECEDLLSGSGTGTSENEPCGGESPLVNPLTGKEYHCGGGIGGEKCPADSYCHKSPFELFAKCCKQAVIIRSCRESKHGCCPDMKTPAPGLNHAGCPSLCNCNKLGAEGQSCDPITKQCPCKAGVGGLRCDRCEPGFWGLPRIAEGNSGCIPCGCSLFGSIRDDCEQMTGRCVCKSGITGMKCNQCPPKQVLGPSGCINADSSRPSVKDCTELTCYFGARCSENEHGNKPGCVCDIECPRHRSNKRPVCGSDGQTYGSECQLKQFSCRYQKDIVVSALGPCRGRLNPTRQPTIHRRTHRRKGNRSRSRNKSSKSTRNVDHSNKSASDNADIFLGHSPTTFVVPGNIGYECVNNKKCTVKHSECVKGKCQCKSSTYASRNKRHCHFLDVKTPAFSGNSMMEMRKLRGYKQLMVQVRFKTYADNGIIMYNGQTKDGNGDFVSLAIKNGFVEFRYDLGNGPVTIISSKKVKMNKFHTVLAKRYYQDGVLDLDGVTTTGRSQGTLKGLNLRTNLYIGNIPERNKRIPENVGVSIGLVGCISNLKIGKLPINLNYPNTRDIRKANDIGECTNNSCGSVSCLNGATCIGSDKFGYRCICKKGFTGNQCENISNACINNPCAEGATCVVVPGKIGHLCACPTGKTGQNCKNSIKAVHEIFIPQFSSPSFLQLPRLRRVGRAFSIELWFMVKSGNGMLLYNGQHASGKGDFISINLVNGYVQFRFNLGSGIANLTTPQPIALHKWHSVKIQRKHRKGMLQVDNGPVIHDQSSGLLTQLNLRQPLFLGGFSGKINPESGIEIGMTGAIQRLIINGNAYTDLVMKAQKMNKILRYLGPPCENENPCKNGGVCIPELGDFSCKCPMKHMGKFCEKLMSDGDVNKPIKFDGKTKFKFPTKTAKLYGIQLSKSFRRFKGQRTNKFEIKLKTKASNGIILWMNKGTSITGDYLLIALRNGFVEFSYNLGKEVNVFIIRSKQKIDDGKWHTLKIHRRKRVGKIQIDNNHPVRRMSEIGATQLNTVGYLWLGGATDIPPGLPSEYYKGFEGCIEDVRVDDSDLHFSESKSDTKIEFCSSS